MGFKAIVFDKDNTLTAPYAPTLDPKLDNAWTECKHAFGTNILIVSNSVGTLDDKQNQAEIVEQNLGATVLRHEIKKPMGGQSLLNHFGCAGNEIVVVGDRILTDVVYGNRIGACTVFCTQIVSAVNDNKVAGLIRKLESFGLLIVRKVVELPKHPRLVD